MKNNLLAAAGLAAFTALVVSRRKHNGVAEHEGLAFKPKLKGRKGVIYPIPEGKLEPAIIWYNALLSEPDGPRRGSKDGFEYAVYKLDDTGVRLDTNPKYPKLSQATFYLSLNTAAEVATLYSELKESNARFAEDLKPINIPDLKGHNVLAQAVNVFVVYDLEGNRVGVTNNPIYPPT
ncbi:hypothetical protein SAMN02745146_3641 [Hymenobacter daecheongensis DSM 21074]|uniref:Uncharacterized protein n=1 Tax=Hymenobacter daecheongensis DSM 21074 TaxID=1121955 RepID=A0A1M6L691_9BACT|nr:hypothetical protein [Hymenobacter daecheongensis]SHJ66743.1 hypothetical protein SAMN02745146_3641 [Hymenobacter daecheongensis DSM 21074]